MAAGNLSPRQKMINMMYLVLTALLALNVSKEVLNSFFEVNKGIERTTNNFKFKKAETYSAFDNAADNNPEKYKEVRDLVYSLKSFDKAIKFLSSEYYNNPKNFEASFTATFDKNSQIYKKLLKIKKSYVQFFERDSGFLFPVTISKLKKNDSKWQYTFWHNFFFNPALNEDIEILYFNAEKEKIKKIN